MNSVLQVCPLVSLSPISLSLRTHAMDGIFKQAFASLSYLAPHIDAIHDKAELLDVPTPVVDTLRETLFGDYPHHTFPFAFVSNVAGRLS